MVGAVWDYLASTDKLIATDTAAQHAAVLATADTARAEVEQVLTQNPAAAG